MIAIIDLNQRIEFVSKSDTTEPKTIFVLKPLSGSQILDLGQSVKDGSLNLNGETMLNFLEKSIAEIKNGPEGLSVRQVIDSLSPGIISELILEISKINHLTGQDAKN